MKEIVDRLHENRQIEVAKSILEAHGYTVTKKIDERANIKSGEVMIASDAIDTFQSMVDEPEEYEDELEFAKAMLDILRKNKGAVYHDDILAHEYEFTEDVFSDGHNYIKKGILTDEDGRKYSGYFDGNRDGMMSFLLLYEV